MNSANTYNLPSTESNAMQSTARPASPRILSAAAVRVGHDRVPVGPYTDEACAAQPRVETRQRNGAINEIVITCGCGQQTIIQCDYNDAATRAKA
jgi:hypothetical protein